MFSRKRINIKQRDITDCGAACLTSVAAFYNLQVPVSRIRQYAGTDKRGTNVLGMIEAAERLGFQAKGARGAIESLAKIPLPAIAHIITKNQLHHYIVLYKVKIKSIVYMDPADGRIHNILIKDFQKEWSGVVLLLLPGEHFISENRKKSVYVRFLQLIKPHTSIMVQAFVGAIVFTLIGLSTSIYIQKLLDTVLVQGNYNMLALLSIIMIALLIFQQIIGSIKSVFALRTGQQIDARLILGYYKHLLKLPQQFFDTMRVGEIISRINDAVKIRSFINDVALNLLVNTLIVSFSIGLMFMLYWKLAFIMLTAIPLYIFILFISNKINKKWQRTIMENSAELEAQLVESLNAIGTVKRFTMEEYSNSKTENRFVGLLKSIYKATYYGIILSSSSEFITRLFTIILLWSGSVFVIQRDLSPGQLLSFYALLGYFTNPIIFLLGSTKTIQDALIAADRLFEIVDLETENIYSNKYELTPGMIGNIRFEHVHFRYGTRTTVFKDLSLTIKKGQVTAIVGESGGGKSTLLSLLQNIYPLQNGNITIGDHNLQYVTNQSLREIIGIVPQNIDLFAGSITENIAIGEFNPDMRKVLFVSQMLGLQEFIEKLPNGYNTYLGEHGINLSGGQRQRIAIARALYRNPEILILDEATSNLDPVSEQKVQDAIRWFVRQGKTVVIIAHRLSTIKNSDWIIVLNEGRLQEEGTHQSLIEMKGGYYCLWEFNSIN